MVCVDHDQLLRFVAMKLSPLTRYYVRRLLQQNAVALGLATEAIPMTDDSEDSAFFDQIIRLESLASTKLSELDLLVRLHQSLSRHGFAYQAYIQNLEIKLFAVMGLTLERHSTGTGNISTTQLAGLVVLSGVNQPSVTLAEALEQLNQVSRVAKKFLGALIARNYWQSVRPYSSWFVEYEISDAAEISYGACTSQEVFLTPEQLAQLQAWLDSFVSRCQRVLPQFTRMLEKSGVAAQILGVVS